MTKNGGAFPRLFVTASETIGKNILNIVYLVIFSSLIPIWSTMSIDTFQLSRQIFKFIVFYKIKFQK